MSGGGCILREGVSARVEDSGKTLGSIEGVPTVIVRDEVRTAPQQKRKSVLLHDNGEYE
jgi:hypothetical protein